MDHAAIKANLADEEKILDQQAIDSEGLIELGLALLRAAPSPIAVKIVVGRRIVFQAAADGATLENEMFCDLKINTVFRCGHASLWYHHHLRSTNRTIVDVPWANPHELSDFGGGVPLLAGAQVVGAVAVSGLAHEDDHRLIVDAMRKNTKARRTEEGSNQKGE